MSSRPPAITRTGIGAARKAKKTDALAVELRGLGPGVEHEIRQAPDIGGTVEQDRQSVAATAIRRVVAGMVDGGHDKARIGQHRGRVAMGAKPAARAVREDDERQPFARDRTVLDGGDRGKAELYFLRWCRTGRPHRARKRGTAGIGRNVDEPQAGGFGHRSCQASDEDGKEGKRAHCSGQRAYSTLPCLARYYVICCTEDAIS
jgi:hypothetical protein